MTVLPSLPGSCRRIWSQLHLAPLGLWRLSQEVAASSGAKLPSRLAHQHGSCLRPPEQTRNKNREKPTSICQELARPLGHVLAELQSREWSLKCLQLFTNITLFYTINYFTVLLYRKGGRGQVLGCLPWDILTIVQLFCRVLNSKPGMGEGGKGRISIKGMDSKTLSFSPILNCNVFPRFSCSLILECDFKEEWNVLGGWHVTISFDWAGPSDAEVYQFCLQTFSAAWNCTLSKSVKTTFRKKG